MMDKIREMRLRTLGFQQKTKLKTNQIMQCMYYNAQRMMNYGSDTICVTIVRSGECD